MKLLLYCTKAKPYITRGTNGSVYPSCVISDGIQEWHLNGKIVAECDFEIEKIDPYKHWTCEDDYDIHYDTNKLHYDELLEKSCFNNQELDDYLEGWFGYAIHIKNLHIFDKPKELSEYYSKSKKINTFDWYRAKGYTYANVSIDKAPQNMMYAFDEKEREYFLISIKPEEMCRIVNKEQTIIIRKKVLKGMLE